MWGARDLQGQVWLLLLYRFIKLSTKCSVKGILAQALAATSVGSERGGGPKAIARSADDQVNLCIMGVTGSPGIVVVPLWLRLALEIAIRTNEEFAILISWGWFWVPRSSILMPGAAF